ncbi:hypothetical protein A9Q91_05415 [Candidatus Gracilibacteria bacterium 28_42_T64]|nr:hypothetical protein A9Q91_05415 [Candidatus Gracilibacteria bacterium 28_42_T64]
MSNSFNACITLAQITKKGIESWEGFYEEYPDQQPSKLVIKKLGSQDSKVQKLAQLQQLATELNNNSQNNHAIA